MRCSDGIYRVGEGSDEETLGENQGSGENRRSMICHVDYSDEELLDLPDPTVESQESRPRARNAEPSLCFYSKDEYGGEYPRCVQLVTELGNEKAYNAQLPT